MLSAINEREELAILDAKSLFPTRIAEVRGTSHAARSNKRVKARQMCSFFSQLADLLRSGVPLLRSLDILERQSSQGNLGSVIREVKAKVADGTSLADAMAEHPRAFNELACSMVHAGQEGGFLEDVLKRIADFTEHQEDLKAKVMGALAYPVILAIIGSLILIALIVFIVPRFEGIFTDLDARGELPTLTVFIVGLSHSILSVKGLAILVGLIVAVGAFLRWKDT